MARGSLEDVIGWHGDCALQFGHGIGRDEAGDSEERIAVGSCDAQYR